MTDPSEITKDKLLAIERWAALTVAYRNGTLDPGEQLEWNSLMDNADFHAWVIRLNDERFTNELVNKYARFKNNVGNAIEQFHEQAEKTADQSFHEEEIRKAPQILIAPLESVDSPTVHSKPVRYIHFLKTGWFRWAAAIIILFGIGAYILNVQKEKRGSPVVQNIPAKIPAKADAPPGGNKATLTLANGNIISLDTAANGQLAEQNGVTVVKTADGQVEYRVSKKQPLTVAYNTMSTPRGGQYELRLPDGTDVWLNAASSITYPTIFTGKNRTVSITGEAYFEVAKDKTKPFIVKADSNAITVLGTSFNVNVYADEPVSKTSLLEGSVRINGKTLQPGQAYENGNIVRTDINRDIAWKNGYFNFDGAGLYTVMRQLSRWYDLQIVYEKQVPSIRFIGKMTRNIRLGSVLKILEGAGVHFRMEEGRKLIVMP